MKSGVYTITCTVNGMVYCGSTSNFLRRKASHFADLKNGIHHLEQMGSDYENYGEAAFEFKVIEQIEDKKLYRVKEEELIQRLKAANCCYNRPNDGRNLNNGKFDRKRLLAFLKANPHATLRDIKKAFNIRHISVVDYHLTKLMAEGFLRRIPAYWEFLEKK
jgi:group I intron endonuclease